MAKEVPSNKFNEALELHESDPQAALENWRELARRYPSDLDVRANYGMCYLINGQPLQAVVQLELATQRNADVNTLTALLKAYGEASMPGHALKTAKRVRDRGGQDIVAALGQSLVDRTFTEKWRIEFERLHFELQLTPQIGAINRMATFAKKTGFLPAYNNITSAAIELMDWKRAFESSDTTLAMSPDNIHALFARVRLEYLTNGFEAAQVWLERVRAAPVGDHTKIFESEATQAQALAVLRDQAGVKNAILAYQKRLENDPEATNGAFEVLAEWLEQVATAPQRPFLDVASFLPKTAIKRWTSLPEKQFIPSITSDLKAMFGVLELLRDAITYEQPSILALFAPVLVNNPELQVPNDSRTWFELFKSVLVTSTDTDIKMQLSRFFHTKELLSAEEIQTLTGLQLLHLEIHHETSKALYGKAEYNQVELAIEYMREAEFGKARLLLESLVKKYPNHATDKFNLAMSYLHDSTLSDGAAQAEALFLELYAQHPEYLFAKSELATLAMKRNNLTAAQAFLTFPQKLTRVHASEYASFLSAQGRLAILQGDRATAEKHLELIEDILDEDSPAYKLLEVALNPPTTSSFFAGLLERGKNLI